MIVHDEDGTALVEAIPRHLHRPNDCNLDRIYLFPSDTRSFEDAVRARSLDLPGFADPALLTETGRIRHRLLYDAEPIRRRWLIGRLAAIATERDRRHGGRRGR
jgi:hypothetical protein